MRTAKAAVAVARVVDVDGGERVGRLVPRDAQGRAQRVHAAGGLWGHAIVCSGSITGRLKVEHTRPTNPRTYLQHTRRRAHGLQQLGLRRIVHPEARLGHVGGQHEVLLGAQERATQPRKCRRDEAVLLLLLERAATVVVLVPMVDVVLSVLVPMLVLVVDAAQAGRDVEGLAGGPRVMLGFAGALYYVVRDWDSGSVKYASSQPALDCSKIKRTANQKSKCSFLIAIISISGE